METLAIVFIVLLGIEILFGSTLIGKKREPKTAFEYIFTVILDGLLIWLLWSTYL